MCDCRSAQPPWGGGLGSSPVRRHCLGEQIFGGSSNLLSLHNRERGRRRLCPVAFSFGPAVLPLLGEDPFQEQRNHRVGDSGGNWKILS